MVDQAMYDEALGALQKGQKEKARDLFTRLLKSEPGNAEYWVWMSALVESSRERIYCLQEALKKDSANLAARRGLVILGAIPPDEQLMPPPGLIRRNWQKMAAADLTGEKPKQRSLWGTLLPVLGGVLILGLIAAGIFNARSRKPVATVYNIPLATEGPSATYLITSTPVVRSATPTFTGPTPLWMQLESTYTPTALYINTPHPRSEAYRAAMAAYQRGNWAGMIPFLRQVVNMEPAAADAYYYMGEAYRLMGENASALEQFNQAIKANPAFAPAYLGRARVQALLDRKTDPLPDLQKAVSIDSGLSDAHLELAKLALANTDPQAALEELKAAEVNLPGSPLIPLYQAQAYLQLDRPVDALLAAQKARDLDFTLLPAYRMLAEARQANGKMSDSLAPLSLYLIYETEDPGAYVLLGRAYFAGKAWQDAEKAYSQALALADDSIDAYLGRGLVYLEEKDGKKALNDFVKAGQINSYSFPASLGVGRAYLILDYKNDALRQFNAAFPLAKTDAERAILFYWRAQVEEALGQTVAALKDWQQLLSLPAGAADPNWVTLATQRLAAASATATGTPTTTRTPTVTATRTPTGTRTATGTRTPTLTSTPKPSATRRITATTTPTR